MTCEKLNLTIHEAGHTIMAYLFHRGIEKVSIQAENEKGLEGYILFTDDAKMKALKQRLIQNNAPRDDDFSYKALKDRALIEREVMIKQAGYLAEKIHAPDADVEGFEKDIKDIDTWLGLLAPNEKELNAYAAWLEMRTRSWLEFNFYLIEGLAQILLKHKELSGRAVRRAIKMIETKKEESERQGFLKYVEKHVDVDKIMKHLDDMH